MYRHSHSCGQSHKAQQASLLIVWGVRDVPSVCSHGDTLSCVLQQRLLRVATNAQLCGDNTVGVQPEARKLCTLAQAKAVSA